MNERSEDHDLILQVELINKVVEHSNAVSSALRLMAENIEEISTAQERIEKKQDAFIEATEEILNEITESGFFRFIKKFKKFAYAVLFSIAISAAIWFLKSSYTLIHKIIILLKAAGV